MRRPLTRTQRKARVLRALSDLSQDQFELASGIPNVAHIEEGVRDLAPSQLARMCSVDGLTLSDCEELLRHYEALRAKNRGPLHPPRRQGSLPRPRSLSIEQVVDDFSARFDSTLRAQHLRALRDAERAKALELWQRIADLKSFEEFSLVLSRSRELQTWAMVERLCEESLHAASKDVERAGLLARLAVDLLSQLQVPESWKLRLLGYAKPHQGNVFRILGDFASADTAFVEAWSLWDSGHDPDELLDPGRILELEAPLRRAQTRFRDAMDLLRQAERL